MMPFCMPGQYNHLNEAHTKLMTAADRHNVNNALIIDQWGGLGALACGAWIVLWTTTPTSYSAGRRRGAAREHGSPI
jgi:hypothetical protein